MQTVFEALGGAKGRRPGRQTGQRVHRYSRTEEGREGRFWQPFSPKNVARFMQAQSAPSCDFGQVGERFGNVAFGIDDGNHRRGQFAPS